MIRSSQQALKTAAVLSTHRLSVDAIKAIVTAGLSLSSTSFPSLSSPSTPCSSSWLAATSLSPPLIARRSFSSCSSSKKSSGPVMSVDAFLEEILLREKAEEHARFTQANERAKLNSKEHKAAAAEKEQSTQHNNIQQQQQQQHSASTQQENTLTDLYGRHHNYLRISLTERCNLRCTYCMPADGVELTPKDLLLSTEELKRLLRLFVSAGITKLRFTGGEPTLRTDLEEIIAYASTLTHPSQPHQPALTSIGITSNGIVLAKKLPALIQAGLTHVNISLDTLQKDKFERITRRNGFDKVMESIKVACQSVLEGRQVEQDSQSTSSAQATSASAPQKRYLKSVKLNSVVMNGMNQEEIVPFVTFLYQTNGLDEIRFIEYMPFDGNAWNSDKFISYRQMLQMINHEPIFQSHLIRLNDPSPNETSKIWGLNTQALLSAHQRTPSQEPINSSASTNQTSHSSQQALLSTFTNLTGKIGFITSMSSHFCSTCNRLRITSDGNIKVCLFGPHEVSLRDAIRQGRTDEELLKIIHNAVMKKKPKHADSHDLSPLHTSSSALVYSNSFSLSDYDSQVLSSWTSNTSLHPSFSTHVSSFSSIPFQDSLSTFPLVSSAYLTTLRPSTVLSRSFSTTSSSSPTPSSSSSNYTLTHLTADGRSPNMVDISSKTITQRVATARGWLFLNPHIIDALYNKATKEFQAPKGPVFTTAIIAGTQAVKNTSQMIPFCHPLLIEKIKFKIELKPYEEQTESQSEVGIDTSSSHSATPLDPVLAICVECMVGISGKTGVEMEALTGVNIALLTIYDMLKAMDKTYEMKMHNIHIIQKKGGKHDVEKK